MVAIFEDFALLSLYGLISPLCAVAIGTGLAAKITILRVSIVRSYRLELQDQAAASGDNTGDVGARLDALCGVALQHSEALYWPSLTAATLFFAFFLWDMTNDSDDPAGVAPWVFLAATLSAVLGIRLSSYVHLEPSSASAAAGGGEGLVVGGDDDAAEAALARPSAVEIVAARGTITSAAAGLGKAAGQRTGKEAQGEAAAAMRAGAGRDDRDGEAATTTTVNPLQA